MEIAWPEGLTINEIIFVDFKEKVSKIGTKLGCSPFVVEAIRIFFQNGDWNLAN